MKETKVGFRLPVDPAAPIIMIGPGTGLAPFRGFLRERAALKAQNRTLGPAMLFFGCRHPDQDFIYADELKEQAEAGLVDLQVAFSRHDGKKTYVQDLLKDNAEKVSALIEQGAIVYVCGDGGRMEPDVKRTLIAMHREKTGVDEAAGEAWMAEARGRQSLRAGRVGEQLTRDAERARSLQARQARGDLAAGGDGCAVHRGAAVRAAALGLGLCRGLRRGGHGGRAGRLVCHRRAVPPAAGTADPAHRDRAAQPSSHRRDLGEFIETNFLAPEPVEARLREVDFAALVADWLSDRDRSAALAGFMLRLVPQALSAIEQGGLKGFLGQRAMAELQRIELAPLAAGLLTAVTEKGRHQRLLDELLVALEKVLANEETLAALREKIRQELPALFNLYRADAYLLRKIVASTTAFIQDARADARPSAAPGVRQFCCRASLTVCALEGVRPARREPEARPAGAAGDRDHGARGHGTACGPSSTRMRAPRTARCADNSRSCWSMSAVSSQRDPAIRAEINRGMVRVLADFVQGQKSGVGRFIADQVKSWDIDVLIGRIELTVGRDLQYIRFNGAMIGGLAGLALHALEQGLKLRL